MSLKKAPVIADVCEIPVKDVNRMQQQIVALCYAAQLIYKRHKMVSGSLEMAECDAVCKAAGLPVWKW